MTAPRPWQSYGVVAGIVVVTTVAIGLWSTQQWGGEDATRRAINIAQLVVTAVAAAACMRRARLYPEERWPWTLAGLGCLSWCLGQAYWTYQQDILGQEVPFPSWAEVGFLGLIPFLAAALVGFTKGGLRFTTRIRLLLDAAVIGCSVFFIGWATALGTAVEQGEGTALERALLVAYPLGDVILGGLAFLAIAVGRPASRAALALLSVGIVAFAVADSAFMQLNLLGTYQTGTLVSVGWIVGFQVIILAAALPVSSTTVVYVRPSGTRAVVAYVPFGIGLIVVAGLMVTGAGLDGVLLATALVGTVLVLGRTLAAVRENGMLAEQADHALQRLRTAEVFRTRLLHTIAHEISNPLTPIQLQMHLLQHALGPLNDTQRHALDIVARNLDQVARLTRDLSDLGKIHDGRLALTMNDVDLGPLARHVADGFRPVAEHAGLALEVETAAVWVHGDADRLRQILSNLVKNAIKFTPKGGRVVVRVGMDEQHAKAEVVDTGRGMTPEETARLFQPFVQVHAPEEAAERGTGLGLYVSRVLAEAHQGTLKASSKGHGKGSTFTLTLRTVPAKGEGVAEVRARETVTAVGPQTVQTR